MLILLKKYFEVVDAEDADVADAAALAGRQYLDIAPAAVKIVSQIDTILPIELRSLSQTHSAISDCDIYPRMSLIPKLRRNGLKGKMPLCHPVVFMQRLLTDSRFETMMKRGQLKAIQHYCFNLRDLDLCWQSIKVINRHGYEPEDWSM